MGAGGHHIAYLKRQVAEVGATVPSRVHRGGRLQPLHSRRIRELRFAYDVPARRVILSCTLSGRQAVPLWTLVLTCSRRFSLSLIEELRAVSVRGLPLRGLDL
jgi:hypothetical protein